MQDIAKSIILKFKGDSKELTQDLKKLETALSALNKGTQGRGGLNELSKSMDTLTKKAGAFGTQFGKSFQTVQTILKEINQKEMKGLEDGINRTSKKLEIQIRALERLKSSGASTGAIDRMQGRIQGTAGQMNDMSDRYQPGQAPPGFMGKFGGLATGIIGVAGQIGRNYNEAYMAPVYNKSALAQTHKNEKMSAIGGDFTAGLLEMKDKAYSEAMNDAKSTQLGRNLSAGGGIAKMIGGGLMIAGGAGTTLFSGGLATLPGALMASTGAGLVSSGASDTYKYFMGGGKEAEFNQQMQSSLGARRNASMTPEIAEMLKSAAPGRLAYQRGFNVSDTDMYNNLRFGGEAGLTESEYMNSTMSYRGRFSMPQANGLGIGAGTLRRRFGTDLGTANQMLGGVAMATGDSANANSKIVGMYSDAFSKGITDSGMIESIQKAVIDASQTGQQVDVAANMSRVADAISMVAGLKGGYVGAREVDMGKNLMAAQENMLSGSPMGQFSKTSAVAGISGGDFQTYSYLKDKSPQELMSLGQDPIAAAIFGGADQATAAGKKAASAALAGTAQTSMGQKTVSELRAAAASGDVQGFLKASRGMAGIAGANTPETLLALTTDVMGGMPEEFKAKLSSQLKRGPQANLAEGAGAAAGTQAQAVEQNALEGAEQGRRLQKEIGADQISAAGAAQRSGTSGVVSINQSVSSLQQALSNFANSLGALNNSPPPSTRGAGN